MSKSLRKEFLQACAALLVLGAAVGAAAGIGIVVFRATVHVLGGPS